MLTSTKLKLLNQLRENSREKLTEISKRTHVPISTLFDSLKEMEEQKLIRNIALIDFPKLGYQTQAQIFLKVRGEAKAEEKERLKQHLLFNQCVNTIYKVNNGWDFLIETVHKNIRELDAFLEELNLKYNLEEKEIHYLVDEIKREGFRLE